MAIVLIFCQALPASAQDTRPPVTEKWSDYKKQVKADPRKKMVELRSLVPGLVYDLRYAGQENFMHRRMYREGTTFTFLRTGAANALQKAAGELEKLGIGFKVFDAYRPYSVTVKFWELVKDERYVANPAKGSGHNRGIAVDLTLIRLATGAELDMGTGFDNFSDTAHHGFRQLPDTVLQNRQLLKGTMEKYGFRALETEWWHYVYNDGNAYEILDIPFDRLRRPL